MFGASIIGRKIIISFKVSDEIKIHTEIYFKFLDKTFFGRVLVITDKL